MKLVNRLKKDIFFYFSYNIMKRGIGPGDMNIDTLIVIGQWVVYSMASR